MRGLEIAAAAVITVMVLGPLALAPAYGPYVEPGTAAEVNQATTPLEEGSGQQGDSTAAPAEDAAPR